MSENSKNVQIVNFSSDCKLLQYRILVYNIVFLSSQVLNSDGCYWTHVDQLVMILGYYTPRLAVHSPSGEIIRISKHYFGVSDRWLACE